LVRCSPHALGRKDRTSGSSRNRDCRDRCYTIPPLLSWASTPLQSAPEKRAAAISAWPKPRSTAPPVRFCAPTASPRAAAAAFGAPGLPRPGRLTPSGFLNLLALHSCRACRPYFRPDPLMGFSLQSFAPRPQPYTVSGASTLMSLDLRPLRHKPHRRKRQHGHKKQRNQNEDPRLQGLAPRESPPPAKAV